MRPVLPRPCSRFAHPRLLGRALPGAIMLLLSASALAQPAADSVPQDHEDREPIAQTTPPAADYPWPDSAKPGASIRLEARFPPPEGFERVPAPRGGFAAWLRNLPLRTDRTEVLAFDGRPLVRPSAAVSTLDVSPRDVQQCADSVLRLHAEYLWATGRAAKAAYHFTSGDRSAWGDWQKGERFRVQGAKVARARQGAGANDHGNFRAWLDHLFRYAGTRSLALDSDPVGSRPYEAGDFFVTPGSPGHAVLLLDVAVNAAGQRAALVGQGFMPAEDFHVLWGQGPRVLAKVWFLLPDEAHPELDTPSWAPFARADGRRLRSPR
jgi:hypothetical protein